MQTVGPSLPSAENQELSSVLSVKPGVGQNNIALRASLTAMKSTFLFSAFPVHLTSFFSSLSDGCDFYLCFDEQCFTFSFCFLLFTTVFSLWDFSHGKFGLPSPGKASCDRVALPNLRCMLGVLAFPYSTEL